MRRCSESGVLICGHKRFDCPNISLKSNLAGDSSYLIVRTFTNRICFLLVMDSLLYLRAVRRLEKTVRNYQEDFIIQRGREICRSSFTELYTLEYTTNYLDLALKPPSHMTLRRRAKTLVHRTLFWSIREFFLAEKVPQNHTVALLYNPAKFLGIQKDSIEVYVARMLLLFESENFLEISGTDPEEKKRILQQYLRVYRTLSVDHFERMFSDLLDLCVNPPLDCELTVDLLTTYCKHEDEKMRVFGMLQNASSLENLILHAKHMRFDFWGLWRENGSLSSHYYFIPYIDPLSHERKKLLLKNGFPYTPSFTDYTQRYSHLYQALGKDQNIIWTVSPFSEHARASSEKMTRMVLIMDTFLIFGEYEEIMDVEDKVETLIYLNRSLPLPYVTPAELYDTMLQVVNPAFVQELGSIVFKYSKADIFDDDIDILMPRRLKHFCRVAVRKILTDNFMVLQQLTITKKLYPYLELEC